MSSRDNHSEVTEFILLGFSGSRGLHLSLLALFLLDYMLTVMEYMVIVAVIHTSPLLHKPMYLFLSHLSFLEAWYVSVTVSKILVRLVDLECQHISFTGCMAQLYFFLALACTECMLLGVMAYDRDTAICCPLRYPSPPAPPTWPWWSSSTRPPSSSVPDHVPSTPLTTTSWCPWSTQCSCLSSTLSSTACVTRR
nr:olfactory receptor 6B1-like [Loxodonta africana]